MYENIQQYVQNIVDNGQQIAIIIELVGEPAVVLHIYGGCKWLN